MDEVKFHGGFSAYERSVFMSDLLNKQVEIRNMLDLRTNIMIGFDSALIFFLATNFNSDWAKSIFFVAALSAVVISMFFALMALKPSHFSTKKGQKESMFYHHEIVSKSPEAYRDEVFKTLADENKVYEAYTLEIYNITKYSNVPRKFYLNWSIRILLYGVFLSLALYLISLAPSFIASLYNLPI